MFTITESLATDGKSYETIGVCYYSSSDKTLTFITSEKNIYDTQTWDLEATLSIDDFDDITDLSEDEEWLYEEYLRKYDGSWTLSVGKDKNGEEYIKLKNDWTGETLFGNYAGPSFLNE